LTTPPRDFHAGDVGDKDEDEEDLGGQDGDVES